VEILPLLISLIVALIVGVPIGIAMGLCALVSILFNDLPLSQLAKVSYGAADNLVLIAVPMFLFAGALMERGGLTKRIIAFSEILVGRATGGLGAVAIVACTFFAAISGSGPATTAAIGALLVPEMIRRGYSGGYAGGVVASAGGLGIVIPPSVPLIVYGIMAEKSATRLFLAGFFPGLLLAAGMLLLNYIICKKEGYLPSDIPFSYKGLFREFWNSKWALLAPVVILGAIYSGATTVTEASALAVAYSLFVGVFFYRGLTPRNIWGAMVSTVRITGVVFVLVASGQILARQLAVANIPELMANAILFITENRILVLLLIIALLVFIGMWMETIAQIIILTPVFLPVIDHIGVDPIHFGIIFAVACEIGFQTPPLGASLFIAKELGGGTFEEVSKIGLMFALVETAVLVLLCVFPQIAMFLPRLIMG
jgi:C4-dicarboxylate transporter DctM subunit